MLVTYQQFAEACGKSRQAISKAVKAGRLTADDDRKIDTESRLAIAYAQSNQHNRGGAGVPKNASTASGKLDRSELENEKLRQQIIKLDLENNIKVGNHIPRDMVVDKIISPLDELFVKMISDLPRSILMNVRDAIGAGMTDGEIEKSLKGLLESHVKRTKRELKNGIKK